MSIAQTMTKRHSEQLRQLCSGPVWDGNLLDKSARDWLFNNNCVHRADGWNFLSAAGVKLASTFGMIRK